MSDRAALVRANIDRLYAGLDTRPFEEIAEELIQAAKRAAITLQGLQDGQFLSPVKNAEIAASRAGLVRALATASLALRKRRRG